MSNTKVPITILRISLAFAFIYPAIAGFINPDAWIGYFPVFIQNLGPAGLLLGVWGLVEILIALALLFLPNPYIPSLVATALLLGVVGANTGVLDVVFRDLSIAGAALALALLSKQNLNKA